MKCIAIDKGILTNLKVITQPLIQQIATLTVGNNTALNLTDCYLNLRTSTLSDEQQMLFHQES